MQDKVCKISQANIEGQKRALHFPSYTSYVVYRIIKLIAITTTSIRSAQYLWKNIADTGIILN